MTFYMELRYCGLILKAHPIREHLGTPEYMVFMDQKTLCMVPISVSII